MRSQTLPQAPAQSTRNIKANLFLNVQVDTGNNGGDPNGHVETQHDHPQALAAFFGARAAMCGANLALGQKESGQSDESSKVHGAVSAAVAGLCLLATQDEEEESKDEKKK